MNKQSGIFCVGTAVGEHCRPETKHIIVAPVSSVKMQDT